MNDANERRAGWVAQYRKNNPEATEQEAERHYYIAYPVEKIKADPWMGWLWIRMNDLDERIKQLEQRTK